MWCLSVGLAERVTGVRTNPARAAEALTEIDHLASDALAETRHAVGVIRSDDALADLRPAPGIDDIEDLVARLCTSDVRVEFRSDTASRSLPAALQTAAYRIVQEALKQRHQARRTRQRPDHDRTTTRDADGDGSRRRLGGAKRA